MRNALVLDLDDCTEFRQALQARPPGVVHGAAGLLVALLGAALAWSALTRADLVVRAPGRVRPVVAPRKVFSAARGDVLSASVGGQVAEVHAREGDEVKAGDLLIRLETGRLDNEIARQRLLLLAAEEELADLARLDALTLRQLAAARDKALKELAQAREAIRRAKEQQAADVRLAQVDLESTHDEERQLRTLVNRQAAARSELTKAAFKAREAEQKLAKARLPVDESQVPVAEQTLAVLEHDYGVKRAELELKHAAKRGEVEAARVALANLELERKQADILAPIGGVVIKGDVKVGDVLEPGKPVLELARQGAFRFEGSVSTDDVGHLKVGMPARVKLDAYDYQRYGTVNGTVCFLSPDSGAAQDSRSEQETQAMTYTVRIALASDSVGRGEFHGLVKLGMAGRAEILTARESVLSLLVRRIRRAISLG
jgi:multidrug efflux pump subunit AcrA (membrane-fusion protein)